MTAAPVAAPAKKLRRSTDSGSSVALGLASRLGGFFSIGPNPTIITAAVSIKNSDLPSVFDRLRELLAAHASEFVIAYDTTDRYGLTAPVGPATLRAWGGKPRMPEIPIGWVEIRKAHVSYHLVGLDGNSKLLASLSEALRARVQGKACFNFRTLDEALLQELETVTAESFAGLKRAGFVAGGDERKRDG